jgi:hypothetical protein
MKLLHNKNKIKNYFTCLNKILNMIIAHFLIILKDLLKPGNNYHYL